MQKSHDFPPLFPYPLTITSPTLYTTHYTICGKSIIQFEANLLYNLRMFYYTICGFVRPLLVRLVGPVRLVGLVGLVVCVCVGGWVGGGGIKKDWKSDDFQSFGVPKKGLEPSRLAAHAPETCASTIPPLGHFANAKLAIFF